MNTRVLASMLILVSPALLAAGGNISKVNGSIRIESGREVGSIETVNGSIHLEDSVHAEHIQTVSGNVDIGRDSRVGNVDSVNGSVTLDAGAMAESVETVNGSLRLDQRVGVQGNVTAVNGSIFLAHDAEVEGRLENVNGTIEIDGARVGDGIKTVSGDIEIGPDSRVDGGILVEKPGGRFFRERRVPKITIGPGAQVNGTLRFEREVELYVSDKARVGKIVGATPIRN